jgi:hypothetical protein
MKLHWIGCNLYDPDSHRLSDHLSGTPNPSQGLTLPKHSIDVDNFSAIYLSYLFSFLEDFSLLVMKRLNIDIKAENGALSSPGFELLLTWIDNLLKILASQD